MPTFTEGQQEDKLNPGQQHADQEFGSRNGTLDPDAIEQQEQEAGTTTNPPSDEETRLGNDSAEQGDAAGKSSSRGGDFTFNNKGEEPQTRGQKAKSFLKKRKLLLLGGGSLLGMIALVLLIIFILGSLPLTTTAVLLERQLDRALRDSANSSEQVVEDKAAADSLNDQQSAGLLNQLRDRKSTRL